LRLSCSSYGICDDYFSGAYDDEEAAAHAYDLAALKYWGPETILNFPVLLIMSIIYMKKKEKKRLRYIQMINAGICCIIGYSCRHTKMNWKKWRVSREKSALDHWEGISFLHLWLWKWIFAYEIAKLIDELIFTANWFLFIYVQNCRKSSGFSRGVSKYRGVARYFIYSSLVL